MAQERKGEPVNYTTFESKLPTVKFPHPKIVYSAGDNSNRHEFLKQCFHHEECIVLRYDVNPVTGLDAEPSDPDENKVMNHKVSIVYVGFNLRDVAELDNIFYDKKPPPSDDQIFDKARPQEGSLIVGVDARTYIHKDSIPTSMGKPLSKQEIYENFVGLLNTPHNSITEKDPYYEVRVATGIVYVDNDRIRHMYNKHKACRVILDKEKLSGLVTEGLDQYFKNAEVFFQKKDKPMENSAGFSLEVLVQMGIVKGLQFLDENGQIVLVNTPQFRNALKQAIQLVAVGTAPELMELFDGVDTTSVIGEWDFLEKTTKKTLQEE